MILNKLKWTALCNRFPGAITLKKKGSWNLQHFQRQSSIFENINVNLYLKNIKGIAQIALMDPQIALM